MQHLVVSIQMTLVPDEDQGVMHTLASPIPKHQPILFNRMLSSVSSAFVAVLQYDVTVTCYAMDITTIVAIRNHCVESDTAVCGAVQIILFVYST